jgi:hypothetical protein
MNKISSKKAALLAFLILLTCISYISFIPDAQAATPIVPQKGLSALNSVVGLDLAKYAITTSSLKADIPNFNTISKNVKDVTYEIVSGTSKLKVLCTFVNDNLNIIHVLENNGTQFLTKAAPTGSITQMAKSFLGNYQTYKQNTAYAEMRNSLDRISVTKNSTVTVGNTQVDVSSVDGDITIKWTYQYNGIIAPAKFVTLSFEDNFFKAFVDNWQLYQVGNTQVSVSKSQATAIALQTAKDHFQSIKQIDSAFNTDFDQSDIHFATLIFDNSIGANKSHSGEKTALYPVYRFGIGLDELYGSLYGLEVDVWADTGEVRWMQEAWGTFPENTTSAISPNAPHMVNSILIPAIPAAVILIACLIVIRRKHLMQHGMLKRFSTKNIIAMASVFVIASTLISSISVAKAEGAYIWGSESSGAYGYSPSPPGPSWRKHAYEVSRQQYVCDYIADCFTFGGYTAYNHQGSYKGQILSDLYAIEHNHDYGAIVDFDHGNGGSDYYRAPGEFHYMFEDSRGTYTGDWNDPNIPTLNPNEPWNGVYDMDIYDQLSYGKIKFGFINTCRSADVTLEGPPGGGMGYYGAIGLPYACTQRVVKYKDANFNVYTDISRDGYGNPDSGDQCYIGFSWGSASLMQRLPYPDGVHSWSEWVVHFFYWALKHDMSVHSALDQTCLTMYGYNFGDIHCPLWRYGPGFTAYWWMASGQNQYGYNCRMEVYGNADIHIRLLPEPTQWWLYVNAYETMFGTELNPQVTIDYVPVGTAPLWELVSVGPHTVGVDDVTWSPFWGSPCYFSYFYTYPSGGYQGNNPTQVDVHQETYTSVYYDMYW